MDNEDARSENRSELRTGGIKDFIAQTNLIGNVIAAAASQKNSFEPLPFSNYSLFDENYGKLIKLCLFHIFLYWIKIFTYI